MGLFFVPATRRSISILDLFVTHLETKWFYFLQLVYLMVSNFDQEIDVIYFLNKKCLRKKLCLIFKPN